MYKKQGLKRFVANEDKCRTFVMRVSLNRISQIAVVPWTTSIIKIHNNYGKIEANVKSSPRGDKQTYIYVCLTRVYPLKL